MISSSSPQQIANQPITRQPLNALSHVAVKTTCWSSKRGSEWGERGLKLWWTWLLVSDGQLVRVFHKLQGNPLGDLSQYNHLLGLQYVFFLIYFFFKLKTWQIFKKIPSSSPVTYSSGLTDEGEKKKKCSLTCRRLQCQQVLSCGKWNLCRWLEVTLTGRTVGSCNFRKSFQEKLIAAPHPSITTRIHTLSPTINYLLACTC